jgi:hypothetical protein
MLSDAQMASMSKEERRALSHRLLAYNEEVVRETEATRQRRRRIIDLLVIVCLGLIPWTVFLGLTLPHRYTADHWEVAWVGYDVALLCALAITAWAAWRRRQIVIVALLVTGTMLVVDAWFDIVTDSTTRDLIISAVNAAVGELPLAGLAFVVAFRLLRLTTRLARSMAGEVSDLPLWRVPLFFIDPIE